MSLWVHAMSAKAATDEGKVPQINGPTKLGLKRVPKQTAALKAFELLLARLGSENV